MEEPLKVIVETSASFSSSFNKLNVSANYSFPTGKETTGLVKIAFHLTDLNLSIPELNDKIRSESVQLLKKVIEAIESGDITER